MDDELRFHVDQYADDLVRTGVPMTEARRRAGVEFGGIGARKEDIREALGLRLLDEVTGDLRYAIRQLRQSPAFTVVAVVSLALGIGANTAIFSLLDAVLFRTLPVKNPQELYYLAHGSGPQVQTSSNYPLFERYKELDIFSGVTASIGQSFKVATTDGAELVTGQFVSGNYHAVLGVPIAIGRGFSSEPDRDLGRTPVAVISDAYWSRRFGRSPDVIGKALTVRGRPVTIVGVTAPGFHGLVAGSRAGIDITLPISVRALDDSRFLDDHGGWMPLVLVGRLKPGISESQALSATDAAFQRYMEEPEQQWIRASLATEFTDLFRSAALLPANRGSDGLRSQYTGRLGVLMAMVGIVLLIACANLANLMLARAAARARELAVRLSIGAGRLRLVRQLLTESLLVSLMRRGARPPGGELEQRRHPVAVQHRPESDSARRDAEQPSAIVHDDHLCADRHRVRSLTGDQGDAGGRDVSSEGFGAVCRPRTTIGDSERACRCAGGALCDGDCRGRPARPKPS